MDQIQRVQAPRLEQGGKSICVQTQRKHFTRVYKADARDLYWKVLSMHWLAEDMIALYKYTAGRGRWASATEGNELFKQKDNVGTRTNWP